ncbi:hypothetical protein ASZ90_009949 [hydrocarbon metagenome]|uniref:Uncharacterized protein n=1 Tax=hydrocarbon metagenome TaxID=938273 RepID=A0A0W8FHX8_9ZZZZ
MIPIRAGDFRILRGRSPHPFPGSSDAPYFKNLSPEAA